MIMIAANPTLTEKQQLSPLQQRLIGELERLAAHFPDLPLCPLNGTKQPQGIGWQDKPFTPAQMIEAVRDGVLVEKRDGGQRRCYPQGFGLLTGRPVQIDGQTWYLMTVDQDGWSAHPKIKELFDDGEIPVTPVFTSGRDGHCQYLFRVKPENASKLRTRKIPTAIGGEQVEFLWLGRQAVLPGSVHPETGSYFWQTQRVLYEVAIAELPKRALEKMDEPERGVVVPSIPSIADDVPLYQCLTLADRQLITIGATPGTRNDSGAKLARNLIGTAQRLNHLGIRFDGDPRQLFDDYCLRCNPSLSAREGEVIWKSAQKDNPTASLTDEALENCAKAWVRNQQKASGRGFGSGNGSGGGNGGGNRRPGGSGGGDGGDGGDGGNGKVIKFPSFDPLTIDQVTEKIDELITQGATGSYLTGQLNRLAAASQFYIVELRKLYSERLGESDLESDRTSNRTEVENLLQLGNQSLDLHDYLPADLATPLTTWCSWLSIRPEVVLLALLAGTSSLHKVGTELVIQRNQNFRVPPTIFAALVSESGQRKSPIFSNIIRQPLSVLRQEKIDAYSAAMEDYEAATEAWEESQQKGSKPEKPSEPTLYYFTNATGEAIPVQANKAPDKALLALIDELSGLLKSENSYRGGRGSDKQDLLSYFDGSGQTVLRAGGVKVDVERIYLSMFGTIQPTVLKNHMEDCSDPDGQWARFLFVNQPLAAATLSDDDGYAVQIRDRIVDFYRQIDQLPEMEYRLSRDAFKRYQPLYNQLERLRVTHPQPGMRAVYSKMEGYIGRLAINLHVLWELASGKASPDVEIPLFILEMAIELAKFFVGQVKIIHAFSDDEELAPHILKLIELSKRLDSNGCDGWIKAKQYQETFPKKKRPSAQQARDWMNESVALGYGRTRGEGNRLEYHWFSDNKNYDDNPPSKKDLGNLGKVGEHLGKGVPQVESLITQGIESNLGNLGNVTHPSLQSNLIPKTSGYQNSNSLLEGGYVPQPSPTARLDGCKISELDISTLGEPLPQPFPNPSPSSPSVCQSDETFVTVSDPATSAETSTSPIVEVEAIAPTPDTAREQVAEITSQAAPLPQNPSSEVAEVTEDEPTLKAGDSVHHPEYGAGTIEQIIGDVAFCTFDAARDSLGHLHRNTKRALYLNELIFDELTRH